MVRFVGFILPRAVCCAVIRGVVRATTLCHDSARISSTPCEDIVNVPRGYPHDPARISSRPCEDILFFNTVYKQHFVYTRIHSFRHTLMPIPFINIHCHKSAKTADETEVFCPSDASETGGAVCVGESDSTVIAVCDCGYDQPLQSLCSVGIHPWVTREVCKDPRFTDEIMEQIARKSTDARVVAIGEAGLDRLRGADIECQCRLFEMQVDVSERIGKPMILHVVKSIGEIEGLRRKLRPRQTWIIHGFRGKPDVARRLMSHGFDLSFGMFYNEQSLREAFAQHRLWLETDDADIHIASHYARVAAVLETDVNTLKAEIYGRATRLSSAFRLE